MIRIIAFVGLKCKFYIYQLLRNRDSCRQLLKNLKILPLKPQYIFPFIICCQK